jgi:hypothetical protein
MTIVTKPYAERAVQTCIQLYEAELNQIEELRRAQPGFPSRAVIIRKLIDLGLKASSDVPTGKRLSAKVGDSTP